MYVRDDVDIAAEGGTERGENAGFEETCGAGEVGNWPEERPAKAPKLLELGVPGLLEVVAGETSATLGINAVYVPTYEGRYSLLAW